MRRTVDIAVALAAIVLLSPILLLAALAIVLDSPGNPIYRGRRVGKDGRVFKMWKFRTMRKDADRAGCITGRNDRRVTWVGAFLRRSKIDELPQFMNLLLGDMTLVGPRPESPEMVALYSPSQCSVLAVKPGVTGRVQLDAGDESDTIPEGVPAEEYYVQHLMGGKLARDLEYLRTRTTASDAKVVAATAIYILDSVFRRPANRNPTS